MCKRTTLTMKCSHFKNIITESQDLGDNSVAVLRRKFRLGKLVKALSGFITKCFITKSLRAGLKLLISIILDDSIQWSSPIAHLIFRIPDFHV